MSLFCSIYLCISRFYGVFRCAPGFRTYRSQPSITAVYYKCVPSRGLMLGRVFTSRRNLACSRRSDSRAREKNSWRNKKEGRLEGERGYNLTRPPLTEALYYLNAWNRLDETEHKRLHLVFNCYSYWEEKPLYYNENCHDHNFILYPEFYK